MMSVCCASQLRLLHLVVNWRHRLTDRQNQCNRRFSQNTYLHNLFQANNCFFVRTRVSVCWEPSEITVFCQQFCLSWNYKVVFVHRSGELDSFNTHCSALTVRICISNSSNVYAWGQKWPRLRRQYDSLYYCYKWLYVFLYHKKLRCLLYLLMYHSLRGSAALL